MRVLIIIFSAAHASLLGRAIERRSWITRTTASCQPRRHTANAQRRAPYMSHFAAPSCLPLVNTFFRAEFKRSLGSAVPAGGTGRVRDVIQFKNHSLSARSETSFFIRENTPPLSLLLVDHLTPRALIHVVLADPRRS